MSAERAVTLDGPDGVPLFGILHVPERPLEPRIGVQLLNPGLKSRVAPNRLNVVLARRLALEGYYVLRFDPPGVGDSPGAIEEAPLPDLWQKVQLGAFVEATRAANDAFARHCGLSEIVAVGNCGGAITALLAAEGDDRVRRLVLMDIPVTVRDRDLRRQKPIRGRRHGSKVLRNYLRRARDPQAWLRLLSLKSDVRTITRAVRARFFDRPVPAAVAPGEAAAPAADGEVFNPMFLRAFESFDGREGRAIFVNAGNYDNTFTFDRLFGSTHLAAGSPWAARHPVLVVPGANHIYGAPGWRSLVIDAVTTFLDGGTVRPEPAARGASESAS